MGTAQNDDYKMTDRDRSPKRVRIVSAFNPLQDGHPHEGSEARRSPSPRTRHSASFDEAHKDEIVAEPPAEANASRFRFKSKHSKSRHRSSRQRDGDEPDHDRDRDRKRSRSPSSHHRRRHHHHDDDHHSSSRSSSHHHHHHHHRHKRRRARSASPRRSEAAAEADPHEPPALDPETAFREALFDAMADDEGALYWAGVYGQPIHVYERDRERVNERGELESMTDDEYAAHVRQKMWEKTHAGLLEERARRAAAREAREEKAAEDRRIHAEMDRSLRRGQERRLRRAWNERWAEYLRGWADWDGTVDKVPWPVESKDRRDIDEKEVRSFFVRGLDLEELGETQFAAKLKDERVRWHPDKIQQKLGGQMDEALMRDVTAIFQIIDKLWADTRPKTT